MASTYVDTVLEEVERGMMVSLKRLLPDTLDEIAAEYVAPDAAFFLQVMGLASAPATDLSMPQTLIMGHDPLVLERPIEDFPTLSTVCYEHPEQSGEGQDVEIDQMQYVLSTAYAEIFSYAQDSDTVNRQSKRYAKALHRAFQKEMVLAVTAPEDASLGRIVLREQVSPSVVTSNVMPAPVAQSGDEFVYFQGARLTYTFKTPRGPYW